MKLQNFGHRKRFYTWAFTIVVVTVFLLSHVSCDKAVAAIQQATTPSARLQRLLKYYDDHFDNQEQLLQEQFISPGYHSGIA